MSILLVQILAASRAQTELVISVLWGLTALYVLAVPLGFLRARNILGPTRLDPQEPVWPVGVVLLLGFFVWMGMQSEYIDYVQIPWVRAGRKGEPPPLTPRDNAFMSTVPFLVGFAVMVVGDVLARAELPSRLGYLPRKLGRGLAWGALGVFLVLPVLMVTEGGQEWLMEHLHYEHPAEHELLHSLGQATSRAVKVCIVVGATVAAPLFEEFLFRGHLQTLLRQMLSGRRGDAVDAPPAPDLAGGLVLSYAPLPRSPWPAWGAVLITSAIFTFFHPMWEWGAIFPLAVCLGYVYERTGNLWSAVMAHLLFNGIFTADFLRML